MSIRKYILSICLISLQSVFAQEYFIYVTAESEDEVAVVKFDAEAQQAETVQRIPVGYMPTEIEGPHGITVSPDGKYWYLSMAHGMPYGKLYKFQTSDNKLVGETELGLFPATMQVSEATGFLYIVNFNLHGKMLPSTVSVVDPESMTELSQITTGAMPHGSRISPDGMFHYSCAMMSGELFEISTLDLEVNRTLKLDQDAGEDHSMHGMDGSMDHSMHKGHDMGGMKHSKVKPTWVIPHPTNGKVYVAGNGIAEVLEVDLEEWKISHRFPTGKGPYNVEITPDGKKMVVTYKSDAQTGIWDLDTREELGRIDNSRKVSHGIALSPDSKYAFVSVEGIGAEPGSVDVIDLSALKRVDVAEVGKQAGGITFWKMQ
ncbi:MAG: beta-propeller fold lactonase family protein [Bacteroidota bacterium]